MQTKYIIPSLSFFIASFFLQSSDHSTVAFSSLATPVSSVAQSERKDANKIPIVDVAIVGAGPSGLALAHCFIDRGYKVKILERRSTFRPVGSAVFLHPFALNSLKKLSPGVAANVMKAATQVGTVTVKSLTNTKNQAVFDEFDKAPGVFGSPFVIIKFWDLLQSLRIKWGNMSSSTGGQTKTRSQPGKPKQRFSKGAIHAEDRLKERMLIYLPQFKPKV